MTTETLEDRLRASAPLSAELPDMVGLAAGAGLLDIAYATHDSPVGSLLLAATPAGLISVGYLDTIGAEERLRDLAARVSPRVLAAPRRLDQPRRELDEYFNGQRRAFDLALDWQLAGPFTRRVLTATAGIPYGSVATYAEIAAAAGSPCGARAAGNALGSNPLPIVVPCHRVLRAGGALGGYTGGQDRKRTLLAIEGAGAGRR